MTSYTPGHVRTATAYFTDDTYGTRLVVPASMAGAFRGVRKALLLAARRSRSAEGTFSGPYVTKGVQSSLSRGAQLVASGHALQVVKSGESHVAGAEIRFNGWDGWCVWVR